MTTRALLVSTTLWALLGGCATTDDGEQDLGELEVEIASAGAWYHLDHSEGTADATLTVVNGYKVRCPDGTSSTTCHVSTLVLPVDCDWECRDGLLSLRGEAVLRGRFEGDAFVATTGLDTWQAGRGTYSIYRLTAAPTCSAAPCPGSLSAQKLNTTRPPTVVSAVDFSRAADPNYVGDPTRGDDQASADAGLLVSGRVLDHVFRADRVWRLWTPRPACEPQAVARAHAGGDGDLIQFRTLAEAERHVVPVGPDEDAVSTHWLVRTAASATAVEFTSGTNDLWAQRFAIDKQTCALSLLAEH